MCSSDLERIRNLGQKIISVPVLYYGLEEEVDIRGIEKRNTNKYGESFRIIYQDQTRDFHINRHGLHHVYAALAAEGIKKYFTRE